MNNILKPFKKLYYKYSWGFRLYDTSRKLDILLIYLENMKIISIKKLNYDYKIIFSDNSILTFWDSNRWYAWMGIGKMEFSNGKIIEWKYEMPSYEVLCKYRKLILNKEGIKKIEQVKIEKNFKKIEDFYEYLPIKLLRKEKLKKIKK